ncbi:MAG: polysaccharide biosynthesis C-terminal domain-containing protein [Chitinophagaceae bacterium]|nr:polysaccharide biosynthesis C-terminal domain-containing protein [Chitinophagaceae bacterium]
MQLSRLFVSNILWRGTYLITSLLVNVLMARYLEASITGELMYFVSLLTFIFMAISLSLESALVFFSASKKITDAKLFTFCFFWMLIALLILSPFMMFHFKGQKNAAGSTSLSLYLYGGLFIVGNLLITYFSSFFYAKHENKIPNFVFIIVNAGLIVFLITRLLRNDDFGMKDDFIRIYFISFFLQGLLCVMLFAIFHRSSFKICFPQKAEVILIIKYSLLAFAANLLAFLLTRIDYWFIENIVKDNEDLGNYIQASRLVQLFQLLPVILASTIFPAVSSGLQADMIAVIQILSRLLFWVYCIVVLLVALTGKWLFLFLFGVTFSKMHTVFLILGPGLLATTIMALICSYLAAINKVSRNVWVAVAGLLLIIPADILVVPVWGIYGAAWVSSAGYIISCLTAFYFLRKESKVNMLDFILIKSDDFKLLRKKI